MKSISISLPDSIRIYVEQQVAQGGYDNVSEYFCQLIRQAQKRQDQEQLEDLLLSGLQSGEATIMTEDDWQEIRQAVQKRLDK